MALTPERAGEQRQAAGQACYTPSARAAHPRAASDFVYPQSILCVCVPYMRVCERVSVNSEKHTFWQKTCDITHLIMALRPCLKL